MSGVQGMVHAGCAHRALSKGLRDSDVPARAETVGGRAVVGEKWGLRYSTAGQEARLGSSLPDLLAKLSHPASELRSTQSGANPPSFEGLASCVCKPRRDPARSRRIPGGAALPGDVCKPRRDHASCRWYFDVFGQPGGVCKPRRYRSHTPGCGILLTMNAELWAEIKRLYAIEKVPIAVIAQRLRLDRK